MKTALIQIYPLFQAKGYAAQLLYRGMMLECFTMADKREALNAAENTARKHGFTHAKICEESAWQKVSNYKITL